MREVNNQYPEFARPYEPVKGAKKHKRLVFGLAVPGFLLISLPVILNTVIPEIILPDLPSHGEPGTAAVVIPDPKGRMFHEYKPKPEPEPEDTPYVPYRRPYRPINNPDETPYTPVDPGPKDPVRPQPQPTEKPVEEKDVRVVITGNNDTVVFNGDDHIVEGFTWTVYEDDENVGHSGFTVRYTANDNEDPFAWGIDPGTYYMELQEDGFEISSSTYSNYAVEIEDGWLKILEEDALLVVTITGNTASYPYDGSAHTVDGYTVSAVDEAGDPVDGSLYTVTLLQAGQDHASATEAGTYPMGLISEMSESDFDVASDLYGNVQVVFANGSLTIEKVPVTVTITGSTGTFKYDGQYHRVEGYTVDIPAGTLLSDTDITGPDADTLVIEERDVGSYSMGLTADMFDCNNGNYTVSFSVTDGGLEIERNPLTVTITGNNETVADDGEWHIVSGYTSTAVDADGNTVSADDYSVELAPGAMAEAFGDTPGTYNMGLSGTSFVVTSDKYSDITVNVVDGWLKIVDGNTAFITITVNSAAQEYTYDGNMHSVHGFTWSAVDADGQAIDSSQISVTMETPSKAGVEAIAAGTHTSNVEESDFTVTSSVYTDYEFVQIIQGTLVINPAPVTVAVTGNTSTVTFDGEEHSVSGYSINIPAGSGLSINDLSVPDQDLYSAVGTEPGSYDMGLTESSFACNNSNYDVTFNVEDGWLLINPRSLHVTISGTTATIPYDGDYHMVSGYTSTAVDADGNTVNENEYSVVPGAGVMAEAFGTEAGEYYMGLAADSFTVTSSQYSPVEVTVNDGWLKITPASTTHTGPDVSMLSEMSAIPNDTGGTDFWPGFRITAWNDLEGGTLKATLYVSSDGGSTYHESTHANHSVTISDDYSVPRYEELQDTEPNTVAVYKAKIMMEYTYSDGTVETEELGPVNMHTDSFVSLNTGYGENGAAWDEDALLILFDVIIDDTKVDPEDVEIEYGYVTVNGTGSSSLYLQKISASESADGRVHWRMGYDVGNVSFPATVNWYCYLTAPDDSGSTWTSQVSYSGTVNN